ncbi:MAG TPA: DUF4388 domain-containing protein [Pyrinomonadaceae bacterium]|nr:DUF4388 domain-containing protein [Pyrinomonadaceae bacterium]
MSDDRNILNFIRTICANGESGRLEILAGAIQGELSFADGKLVDARVGHLTGFRAINAVAAMRDARFSFDPAFTPLGSSSITASERVVLKQFFGIDTAATSEYFEPAPVSWPEEAAPVATAASVADTPDEVTIVSSNVATAEVPTPLPSPSRSPYRTALAVAALVILAAYVAAAAVFLYRSAQRSAPAVVAGVETSSRPAAAQQSELVAVNSTPAQPVSAPAAPVKREEKPITTTLRDLSGKWNIINTIDATSYTAFKNLKIGFNLAINQTGTTFTGNGQKVSENGRTLPAGSRTPIQVKGTIKGDRIEATFFEQGAARKSNGTFVWRIDKAGRGLTGNFATNAARSRGKSAATREL